jgi:hypothetical protein
MAWDKSKLPAGAVRGIDLWPAQALRPRAQAPEQPKASPMPGDNGFWFDDHQDVASSGPKTAEQNPKYSILGSQPGARRFSFEYAQLLTEGKDLKTEIERERKNALRQQSWVRIYSTGRCRRPR